jgi:hypothetical protein
MGKFERGPSVQGLARRRVFKCQIDEFGRKASLRRLEFRGGCNVWFSHRESVQLPSDLEAIDSVMELPDFYTAYLERSHLVGDWKRVAKRMA